MPVVMAAGGMAKQNVQAALDEQVALLNDHGDLGAGMGARGSAKAGLTGNT